MTTSDEPEALAPPNMPIGLTEQWVAWAKALSDEALLGYYYQWISDPSYDRATMHKREFAQGELSRRGR